MAEFDRSHFFDAEFTEHAQVVAATKAAVRDAFSQLLSVCVTSLHAGGKIMFFGNGGSAADAQHLATELSVRYKRDRAPIAGLALTTDTSTLTAAANDIGFDAIFARQLEAIGRKGDVAIGISTSGRSPNVLKALQTAKSMGIHPVAFTGGNGGELPGVADPMIIVPSTTTARIQEMHILIGQMLCGALELELGLVESETGAL